MTLLLMTLLLMNLLRNLQRRAADFWPIRVAGWEG